MTHFLDQDGLTYISRIMDSLLDLQKLTKKITNLITPSIQLEIVEHLSACYREISLIHLWKLVKHSVIESIFYIIQGKYLYLPIDICIITTI